MVRYSIFVESLNLRARRAAQRPVPLHEPYLERRGEPSTATVQGRR